MDMASLFPHEADPGATPGGGDGLPHVAFKCGRMNYNAETGQVTPDERRGMLQIVTGTDLLTHLQWRTRPGGSVDTDHDLIIFPGLAEMKPVTSAPNGSRVYVLKWIDANTRMFFWMQDGDATQDTANISRLNSILQNGPHQETTPMDQSPPVTSERHLPAEAAAPATNNATATAAAAGGAAVTAAGGGNGLTLDTLSRMLDAMPNNPGAGGPRPVVATAGDLLRAPQLAEFVDSPGADNKLAAVYETIPAIERNPESVKQLLRCEAVQSQALSLTRALLEAPPSDVLPSLGLPLPDTPGSMGMKALIEAIKKAANHQ